MRLFLIALLSLSFFSSSQAQPSPVIKGKSPIDFSVFNKWPRIESTLISNNGAFICCKVYDPIKGNHQILLKSVKGNWFLELVGDEFRFSNDSQKAIFKKSGDSLCIVALGTEKIEYIPNVVSFKIPEQEGNELAYLLRNNKSLKIHDSFGRFSELDSIVDYYFSNDGHFLIAKRESTEDQKKLRSVFWIDLIKNERKEIWRSNNHWVDAVNFTFCPNQPRLVFLVSDFRMGAVTNSIWYFENGQSVASTIIDTSYLNKMDMEIGSIDYNGFIPDGKEVFIGLIKKNDSRPDPDNVRVDVWSYKDSKLQSQQLTELNPVMTEGLINIRYKTVVRIEGDNEKMIGKNENYAIVVNCKGAENEWNWNKTSLSTVYLVSLKDGTKIVINDSVKGSFNVTSSYSFLPGGKFVIYYDAENKNYFSYEIATGVKRNLTSSIKTVWTTYVKRDLPMAAYMPIGIAGAIDDGKAVLVYDQCDIFQLDPLGKTPPVNITNGYGRKNNIEFRLLLDRVKIFESDEKILVSGFNRKNKNDGFYEIQPGKAKVPRQLISQPYIYKGTWEDDNYGPPVSPVKAKDANVYLVRRMSAKEAPNYFWTEDFKIFNKITNIHPEKNYNWLTTELITWKTYDNILSQGILYKPEDFDPHKKYPVIFNYYENSSEGLNGFPWPIVTSGPLNIPYYVSNGYLVFTPDMHYTIGHSGQSVVNTIVSAAKYLSRLPFVDSKHMGLQGHSRGGWQTDFIITHTNIFAAAMSSSGFCDYISLYNWTRFPRSGAISRQSAFEMGYQRIGATLWERPELFIENSPVLKANKVTTPLLMMSNKQDNDIPFEQGVEFYTALRRLGKTVWMLQYDGQGHLVSGKASEDLEIRMKQFFDHYLKGGAAPFWMTTGIPASMKGKELGYQLDVSGRCNPNCPVCKKINLQNGANALNVGNH
jgi:dienelactone hydrolase